MNNIISQRVIQKYNNQTLPIGCFVGMSVNNQIRIGWSRCNFKAGDQFDMAKGQFYAIQHLLENTPINPLTHQKRNDDYMAQYQKFRARCQKFFKDQEFATEANENVEDPQTKIVVDQVMSELEANGAKGIVPRQLVVDLVNPLRRFGNLLWRHGVAGSLVKAKVNFTGDGIKIEKQEFTEQEKAAVQT